MTELPKRIGVVGAGTMGAGIAQLTALAGMDTLVYDPLPQAIKRGVESIAANLEKGAERERWTSEEAAAALARVRRAEQKMDLSECELVIEAAPERLELKHELFAALGDMCGPETVLASNTSSIPITEIASASTHPEMVIGLHFFNPPALMKLVELIPGIETSERALEIGRAVGEAMGKRVINAPDGPGFLVNRCGRPFGSEALRLLQERLATIEEIDAIYKTGGGYKMGPFELMDLVGIDVGYAVARSFMELSFGEPRWKPNPLQAKMVAAGRLGRKTGRGWYDYTDGTKMREGVRPPSSSDELLNRVQCCIVNEGVFALGEGVGTAADIDAGTKLGLNWPKGPIELGQELGFDHVLATMDALFDRYHEERYRAAPMLRDGVKVD